jgi:hypothetical protein
VATFEIAYASAYQWLFSLLGMGPRHSGVQVDRNEMHVHMGWVFDLRIGRAQIQRAARTGRIWWAVGVHVGPKARWVVNGSTRNMVTISLEPEAVGRLFGFPVRVRSLSVSVVQPEALLIALAD